MAGDWRINADERLKYDSYFQQCGPVQGYVTGDQARNFFIKSGLPADVLRKIWDLSDITNDGRLDKREFTIACHLIASQVQKKIPLPLTLPPTLLSDAIIITANGAPQPTMPILPLTMTRPTNNWSAPGPLFSTGSIIKPAVAQPLPLTPAIRSKYLQQFHSLVDVTKTNGCMNGSQAKNILQQTGLSQTSLHQIWNLADIDKDGRFTPDEFVIAMHCCDMVRSGQMLPSRVPDEWLNTTTLAKSNPMLAFGNINADLRDAFTSPNNTNTSYSPETVETERKNSIVTYEDKRLKNYEDGYKELERRRQLLREQEERDQREREERERKRELELQKHKEEQERKKQLEHERQVERQKQIEQQKEEERRKILEQREAARKEMERKSRLEWERQRMQELSTQKSRLLEQINDLKSRDKALALELQSMDDSIQTNKTKVNHINTTVQTIDQTITDLQKRTMQEKSVLDKMEQQRRDLHIRLNQLKSEKDSLDSSLKHLSQSKEFNPGNRNSDQTKFTQLQLENVKQESARVDEQIANMNQQCKQYQNQMEQLRRQLVQMELDAKNKKPEKKITPPTSFPSHDPFRANNDFNAPLHSFPPVASPSALDVDPFKTVDPFASTNDIGSPTMNAGNSWFTPATAKTDPFQSKSEIPSKQKEKAPTVQNKSSTNVDPWGGSSNSNNNNTGEQAWPSTYQNTASPFDKSDDWAKAASTNQNAAPIQYRALYEYTPERADEIAMAVGDIITVDSTQKQQDENWLYGKIGNGREGFFPAAYAERILSTPSSASGTNMFDTTSQLMAGSWVTTLADYQGKTADKHLSFQKGELILVREQKDTSWYIGELRAKIGWFPRNYVRPATEVEIQNNKNTNKTALKPEIILNSPTSPTTSTASNDSSVVWRPPPVAPTIPDIYEAVYAYDAADSADLSFNAGDRISVIKREGDWWTGRIGDRVGTFPNNYVQKVDTPIQETAVAIAPFHTNDEGRLSFDVGQLIYLRRKGDKGWFQGEIRVSDQPIRVGWFPANCVQLQTPPTSTISSLPTYQNAAELPRCMALFPYDAQQDDELSFPADAILEILEQGDNEGWFKARYGNKIGLIPSTYVKQLDETNASSTPKPHRRAPSTPPFKSPSKRLSIENSAKPQSNGSRASSPAVDRRPSQNLPNNPLRISAIRELIETEQRYVDDLSVVSNEFIKPLNNARALSDYEIQQIFINWYNLIALNSSLLTALHEQVDYKEEPRQSDHDVVMRTSRSASLTNIALAAQLPSKNFLDSRHRSFTPEVSQSPSFRQLKHRTGFHHRSPSITNLAVKPSVEYLNDNNNPPPSPLFSSGSMTITDATKVGDILCNHLPTMADDYFQYCNQHSQANKAFQMKMDSNEEFRSHLKIFQDKTGGLSLNGFLTKPIQRVTRYPLLIEKVLKHTPADHPDYQPLKEALDCARYLNERINKQISEQESSSRLDWIQQHLIFGTDDNSSDGYLLDELLKFNSLNRFNVQRKLLLHGLLTKAPSGKDLLAFLFNDFILFSTIKSSSTGWQTQIFEPRSNLQLKLYRLPLFLTDVIIANDSLNDQLTFSITTKIHEKPIVLKAQQTNVRTLWVKSINNAVEECQAAEKSTLAEKAAFSVADIKRDSKAAVARLLLVVQEAHDLMPSSTTRERHRSIDPYCEITVASLTLKTPFVKRTINPKWNAPMQFLLYNLAEDVININLFDNEYFSPNENLGNTSIHLIDILPCPLETFLLQPSLPFIQRIYLNNGSSVVIKFVVQILAT